MSRLIRARAARYESTQSKARQASKDEDQGRPAVGAGALLRMRPTGEGRTDQERWLCSRGWLSEGQPASGLAEGKNREAYETTHKCLQWPGGERVGIDSVSES